MDNKLVKKSKFMQCTTGGLAVSPPALVNFKANITVGQVKEYNKRLHCGVY
ncbi:hypothetical protein [Kriegella aquimaris]|uniref:Uncharacterized protein n=1 Tax=Kriegella aquimaris TaxID=192904 RepID=A0A1G9YIE4_9FLAO|nr:hypothetical protein [Kriegella aquimaris]SDN08780.1 hypothetical protein SAMN04488514_12316 [Kriegella aquimaris]